MNKNTVIKLVLVIGILVCGGYLIADGVLSSNRVQARIDKTAGGPLIRSVQMSDAEVSARQTLGRFAEYENHYRGDCTGITNLEVLFTKESDSLSDAEVKCLKQVMASPASFTKITGKWFEDEPDPIWVAVGEMSYVPNQPGWTTKKISIPPGISTCRITCVQGYNQYFTDKGYPVYIAPTGKGSAKVILEDNRFAPHAQLIRVNNITKKVQSHDFVCDDTVQASFVPNMQSSDPTNFHGNTGTAVFVVEKLLKPTS